MLWSLPPEIYRSFSEFYFPPVLSMDGGQARTADKLDPHQLRGTIGATIQMRLYSDLTREDQQEQMQTAQSQPCPSCFCAAVEFHLFLGEKIWAGVAERVGAVSPATCMHHQVHTGKLVIKPPLALWEMGLSPSGGWNSFCHWQPTVTVWLVEQEWSKSLIGFLVYNKDS